MSALTAIRYLGVLLPDRHGVHAGTYNLRHCELRAMIEATLHLSCADVRRHEQPAVNGLAALDVAIRTRSAESTLPAIILCDNETSSLHEQIREISCLGTRRVLVVLLTDTAPDSGHVWSLLRAGADDVLIEAAVEPLLGKIAARLGRWAGIERLLQCPLVRAELVGSSRAWLTTLRQVIEVSAFSDGSVLLLGESGTGKELITRLIHTLDRRPDKRDLVVLDCTTVAPELSGSEFFGHERGAFTGATNTREGAFALAHGGTLFLDEVGELPLPMQAQLLRAVQERMFKRVGSNAWNQVQFRLVCATHRDLDGAIAEHSFRRDFFHRIASRVIRVPPLRDRVDDILPLATHFMRKLSPGRPEPVFAPAVADFLRTRSYPGNVRELSQLIGRMADRSVGDGLITPGDLPPDEVAALEPARHDYDCGLERAIERAVGRGACLRDIGRTATTLAIQLALASEGGNVQRAARRLGVTDRALQMRRAQAAS